MRRRIVMLSALGFGQLLSAIALVAFIPHLLQIWYNWGLGWDEAIKAEYAQGGYMMVLEFILIVVVLICTIIVEVWLVMSTSKAAGKLINELNSIREHMDNGLTKLSKQIGVIEENTKGITTKNE